MAKEPCYVTMRITTRKGAYTVGILPEPPEQSYKYNIISLGLQVDKKTKPILVMTPKEAVMFGVGLIRASILAEIRILKNNPNDADWAINWESIFEKAT